MRRTFLTNRFNHHSDCQTLSNKTFAPKGSDESKKKKRSKCCQRTTASISKLSTVLKDAFAFEQCFPVHCFWGHISFVRSMKTSQQALQTHNQDDFDFVFFLQADKTPLIYQQKRANVSCAKITLGCPAGI